MARIVTPRGQQNLGQSRYEGVEDEEDSDSDIEVKSRKSRYEVIEEKLFKDEEDSDIEVKGHHCSKHRIVIGLLFFSLVTGGIALASMLMIGTNELVQHTNQPTPHARNSSTAGVTSVNVASGNVQVAKPGVTSGVPYSPGSPGGSWSQEEALIVKAKLWRILSLKKSGVDQVLQELHGPGWEDGPLVEELLGFGRFMPTAIRLGFHGCLRDADGTGGCDGCLYTDNWRRIYLDYWGQHVIPLSGPGTPNFNNGLAPVADVLEAVYTNKSFPDEAPSLQTSLRDSGKSRADLWALAGIVSVEYATATNNAVCSNPNFEWPTAYPDSLETNSYFGKHCVMKHGTAGCKLNVANRIKFRTGRKDCVPVQLYKKVQSSTCLDTHLEIRTEADCVAAGSEHGGLTVQFSSSPDGTHCSISGDNDASLCYLSAQEKYNTGQQYYVLYPLNVGSSPKPCRADLAIQNEADCKQAATYLMLPFEGSELLDASGCFVMVTHVAAGQEKLVVGYKTGLPPPADDRRDLRSICRMPAERVQGYMASTWGHAPGSQMNGTGTVNWFKEEFGLNPRETIALMGAHGVGRFHARQSLFRYIWIRNGGMTFNTEYYANMANRPGYRFTDPDCKEVGDAFSQAPRGSWRAFRRGEQVNGGPIWWSLYRHICQKDCRSLNELQKSDETCCQNVPYGGTCKPDNGRTNASLGSVMGDPDPDGGCEKWDTEAGNHEITLPSEMGLYYKFNVDANQQESGCPGFDNFNSNNPGCNWFSGQNCKQQEVGCGKNDNPADSNLKMHEVVELYADNQDVWIKEFNEVFEKVLQNGHSADSLTEGPDPTTNIVCPWQDQVLHPSMAFYSCFSRDQLASSEPFYLRSEKDNAYLQVNAITGKLELAASTDEKTENKKWYELQTDYGTQLVNGLMEFGVGNLHYDRTSGFMLGGAGSVFDKWRLIARGWSGLNINFDATYVTAPWFASLYKYKLESVS